MAGLYVEATESKRRAQWEERVMTDRKVEPQASMPGDVIRCSCVRRAASNEGFHGNCLWLTSGQGVPGKDAQIGDTCV